MAKRQKGKPKKSKAKNHNSPISDRTRKKLTSELKKARDRIRGMMARDGASYTGPSLENFYLSSIIEKIKEGMHINTVYAMIKNTTARKIRKAEEKTKNDVVVSQTYSGQPVTQKQYTKLNQAIMKANKNIEKAREKYPEATDVLPDFLYPEQVLNQSTTTESINKAIRSIESSFKPSKLVPIAINDDGEAGTQAELEYLKRIVDEENDRRARTKQMVIDIWNDRGILITNDEFSVRPLNITNWRSMDDWRRYTSFFTDARDYKKASQWVANYERSLNALESVLLDSFGYSDTDPEFKALVEIREKLHSLKDPEQIRMITRFSEYINVKDNYIGRDEDAETVSDIIFELIDAWTDVYRKVTNWWEDVK